jgi:DUF4097 and DUF4098 domain-containing protein YvlB
MLTRLFLASALIVALAPSALAAEGTFERALSFSGVPSVSVSTGSGYVHVYPGQDGQLHVIGRVHSRPGWFGGDPEARVREIVAAPPIVQSGNIITLGQSHDSEALRNVSIDYEITTPAQTTLKANSGSGSLEIGGILGAVTARSGSGSIHGDNVGGNSSFSTGSGSIRAEHVHGAATANTGSGHIDLSLASAGDVQARTGSGGIRLSGINGGLRATTGSGSIEVDGNPTSEWRLETGSGGVRLKTDPRAHFTLNASTGSGGVHVEQPIVMQGSLDKHHVIGTVNGGGPTVRASTGSGSINIE